ncbi:hypothetical protein [Telluribacter sp.]|jgi:hypothetical protein|uniref:hypothetical protein n=1 Tax=Telluribacter sp. TaxID=1978767 RepID=UPI002E11A78D|nr:hypothetical protein [Telluribacter sp.]
MPLTRFKEQKKQTLEEFYSEWASSDNTISSDLGKAMLRVIEKANQTFIETAIFSGTSHAHLLLFTAETNDADWYVAIIANAGEYHIEYRMSKDKQPWQNATVKGATKSLDDFMNYIIIAMNESGAWAENIELKRLYMKLKADDTQVPSSDSLA